MPRAEYDALVAEDLAYDDEFRRSGHFVMREAPEHVSTATTVYARDLGNGSRGSVHE
jgi:hypothetical protein